ncbi:hypothetical protein D3C86_2027200 [compost metagenome]
MAVLFKPLSSFFISWLQTDDHHASNGMRSVTLAIELGAHVLEAGLEFRSLGYHLCNRGA